MQNTVAYTSRKIFVKVFGFSEAERHLLSTGLRLAESGDVSYAQWSAEVAQKPEIALIDGDSWEAVIELANPAHDVLKLIWVGENPPLNAWKSFARPVEWSRLVAEIVQMDGQLDSRLAPSVGTGPDEAPALDFEGTLPWVSTENVANAGRHGNTDTHSSPDSLPALHDDEPLLTPTLFIGPVTPELEDRNEPVTTAAAHSTSQVLLIEPDTYTRMYWRAKLGAVGLVFVDEAATAEVARQLLRFKNYKLVIFDMNLDSTGGWAMVRELQSSMTGPHRLVEHLIVTGESLSRIGTIRAWFAGAVALRKPIHPGKLKFLLERIQSGT